MTLFTDSTALIALGEIDAIDVLRFAADVVVITPVVQDEVKRSAAQISAAISDGWMHIEPADIRSMQTIIDATGLDEGEASIIEVARRHSSPSVRVLIDERRAFDVLSESGDLRQVCLAQVLHEIEDGHPAVSCREITHSLVAADRYRWAKVVRLHYEFWCAESGRVAI